LPDRSFAGDILLRVESAYLVILIAVMLVIAGVALLAVRKLFAGPR
jgi:hypothetical protein